MPQEQQHVHGNYMASGKSDALQTRHSHSSHTRVGKPLSLLDWAITHVTTGRPLSLTYRHWAEDCH